ncbi:RBM12B [Symbiodinium sp. CCMP2592]|nr:RBM12B [Symbiodinium sp. CCMP2592]
MSSSTLGSSELPKSGLSYDWFKLEGVSERGAGGRLVVAPGVLTRPDLDFNWNIVAAAMGYLGARPSVDTLEDEVDHFFQRCRQRGKKPVCRNMASRKINDCGCNVTTQDTQVLDQCSLDDAAANACKEIEAKERAALAARVFDDKCPARLGPKRLLTQTVEWEPSKIIKKEPVIKQEPSQKAPQQPPPQKPLQEPPQKPLEEPPQKPLEEPPQKPLVEPPQKPLVEPPQKPLVEPPQKPLEEPPQKPLQEPPQKPSVEPPQKPLVEPPEKPLVEPPQKPLEEPPQKPLEEPRQKPWMEPPQKPLGEPQQKPLGKPPAKPSVELRVPIKKEPLDHPIKMEPGVKREAEAEDAVRCPGFAAAVESEGGSDVKGVESQAPDAVQGSDNGGDHRCTDERDDGREMERPALLSTAGVVSPGEQLRKLLLDHGTFDKIEGVLEKWHVQKKKSAETGNVYAQIGHHICPRLSKNLTSCLVEMNECYKKLTEVQADAATTDNEANIARQGS